MLLFVLFDRLALCQVLSEKALSGTGIPGGLGQREPVDTIHLRPPWLHRNGSSWTQMPVSVIVKEKWSIDIDISETKLSASVPESKNEDTKNNE